MPVSSTTFDTRHAASSEAVTWIHIGDPHLTRAGEANEIDLGRIVDEINAVYARGGVDFVYVPGDIADDGSAAAYKVFRQHLDRLHLPWLGIVGDHDVHEKSFANFQQYVDPDLHSAFSIGRYRFIRLNAFSHPEPDSFTVDANQLHWLEEELERYATGDGSAVLFLHCYPSDLKQGGPELTEMIHRYRVLLVDMGHTHYNEISNDGVVLYSATRSTGQIEEGPAGYSVTTIDHDVVSWHFVELGSPSLLAITRPADARLMTSRTRQEHDCGSFVLHAKAWSCSQVSEVEADLAGNRVTLHREKGAEWSGKMNASLLGGESHKLVVRATDETQLRISSEICFHVGVPPAREIFERDQDNTIGAWEERGLLGTQLGPNKNGRKW